VIPSGAAQPIEVVDPDVAREQARDILSGARYESGDAVPRPLRGPLEWLGDRLRPLWEWLADVASAVPWPVWVALAVAIVAAIVWALVCANERRRLAGARHEGVEAGERPDPAVLEAEAERAERAGDLARAVRLRFRAGLLRLDLQGTTDASASTTNTEVRATVDSATFDTLSESFEEIAYRERAATGDDTTHSRNDWPRVLEEARRR
jgi:hypothetical protein